MEVVIARDEVLDQKIDGACGERKLYFLDLSEGQPIIYGDRSGGDK